MHPTVTRWTLYHLWFPVIVDITFVTYRTEVALKTHKNRPSVFSSSSVARRKFKWIGVYPHLSTATIEWRCSKRVKSHQSVYLSPWEDHMCYIGWSQTSTSSPFRNPGLSLRSSYTLRTLDTPATTPSKHRCNIHLTIADIIIYISINSHKTKHLNNIFKGRFNQGTDPDFLLPWRLRWVIWSEALRVVGVETSIALEKL